MQRQPDRQRDHHHRERIAAEHNTGHLVGLTLVPLAQDVIQYRRGSATDSIRSGIQSGSRAAARRRAPGRGPRQQVEQVAP